ncbi:MAG: Ycf66 family protein [Myxacorys californica WJT36-NPBG1]|jgi:hypothetical protein|nr:Ycf66 family protein [Myxacorys californica WJT36-NPBG1]
MLTFLLALLVGLGSFALYLSGFLYPEVYRKNDLIWSGVGLFYALVLLVCGDRITGGVLLGQIASTSLIGWFAWQTLDARLGHTPSTEELKSKVGEALQPENRNRIFGQMKQQVSGLANQVQTMVGSKSDAASTPGTATAEPYKPLTREDFGNPTPTVETSTQSSATEAQPTAAKPDIGGAIAGIGQTIGGLFKKPQKNTEVYVRKEFREEATPTVTTDNETVTAGDETVTAGDKTVSGYETDAIVTEEAVEAKTVPVNQPGASDSDLPSDEIVQEEMEYEATRAEEPVPPHPPSPDLVEAAIEDAAEKDLPADPPPTEGSSANS